MNHPKNEEVKYLQEEDHIHHKEKMVESLQMILLRKEEHLQIMLLND